MSEREYEAFERFCIMSEQSDVGDIAALKYVQEIYGRETAVKIWEKYCKEKNNGIQKR